MYSSTFIMARSKSKVRLPRKRFTMILANIISNKLQRRTFIFNVRNMIQGYTNVVALTYTTHPGVHLYLGHNVSGIRLPGHRYDTLSPLIFGLFLASYRQTRRISVSFSPLRFHRYDVREYNGNSLFSRGYTCSAPTQFGCAPFATLPCPYCLSVGQRWFFRHTSRCATARVDFVPRQVICILAENHDMFTHKKLRYRVNYRPKYPINLHSNKKVHIPANLCLKNNANP